MTDTEINELEKRLKPFQKCKTPQYARFQYKTSDCTITAYESGKVVFQGSGADFYDSSIKPQSKSNILPQCGSDEVGTGDYFGPVVVCATCVKESDLKILSQLNIQDSKQLTDPEIIKIAPKLMEQLDYSLLVLENQKYNKVHQDNNMNKIKARMHNQALLHLLKKTSIKPAQIIIDQFTPERSYYRYVANEPEIVKGIHFETKAENKYLSVACGSIIARYTFVKAINQMSEKYSFDFPKGAGKTVDRAGFEFIKTYSISELSKVAKLHFKNTDKIKELK